VLYLNRRLAAIDVSGRTTFFRIRSYTGNELKVMRSTSLPLSSPSAINQTSTASTVQSAGTLILRYGLVLILLLGGAQKWTKAEAEGIRPWIAHSPVLSWMYSVTSVQGASEWIGVCELAIALLIAVRRWSPKLAAIGSIGAVFMFLTTLSFLVTTPNQGPDAQGFLMKDVFLLGAALWSAGEAWEADARRKRSTA
jgi:uncharacterized membrane protein YkgB